MGGVLHLAGPAPAGGWRVIEVWNSPEEAKRFLTDDFAPALRAAVFEGTPPVPQFWPVLVHEAAHFDDESRRAGNRAGDRAADEDHGTAQARADVGD